MYKRLLVSVIAILFIMIGILGCQNVEQASEPIVTVIIAGNHGNSQKIECDLKSAIKECYSTFGNIAVILNDATPSVLCDAEGNMVGVLDDEKRRDSKIKSQKNRSKWEKSYLNKLVNDLFERISNANPDSNESDMLTSIQKAVDTLRFLEQTATENVKKQIIIYDTGLSTHGKLNFLEREAHELLGSNKRIHEDDISRETLRVLMETLDNNSELPDMHGISVEWYGGGAVGYPQKELSQLQVSNLKFIWQTLLEIAGADFTENANVDMEANFFKPYIAEGIAEYEYYVTPVIFWKEDDIKIKNEKLGFKKNSAELLSKDAALEIIEPYARNLNYYPNINILVVGTTADDRIYNSYPNLSEDRAMAVKQILVNQGIDTDRIEVLGLGADSPWHQSEWRDGVFIEEIAAENRAVHILARDSETAKDILKVSR